MVGLHRSEVEPGLGEEAVEEAGPVLHPFEPGLHQRSEWPMLCLVRLARGRLEVQPHGLGRVEFGYIRRELADGQPGPGGVVIGVTRPRWPRRIRHTAMLLTWLDRTRR